MDPGLRVFICYRRDDTGGYARALKVTFEQRYGADHVFMDLDSIALGVKGRPVVQDAVTGCDAFVVLIGKRWQAPTHEQAHGRLDDPHDFVRFEIETALRREIAVFPMLLDHGRMPGLADLPESLADLANR